MSSGVLFSGKFLVQSSIISYTILKKNKEASERETNSELEAELVSERQN